MIDNLLHLIGICPDSFNHFNIVGFISTNYSELKHIWLRYGKILYLGIKIKL
jgi:hypothetical protein